MTSFRKEMIGRRGKGWSLFLSIWTLAFLALPAAPAAAAQATPRTALVYQKIYGLTVNLFSQGRVDGQFIVSLDLEAKASDSDTIRGLQPKLRDAYNRDLISFGETMVDPRRPLDLKRLEAVLQRTTDTILGQGKATALLFSAVVAP
jgi:hypothetical protein